MIFYLFPNFDAFLFVVLFILCSIWLVFLYRKGASKRKSFKIQFSILMVLSIAAIWYLRIFPFAHNIEIMNLSESLTGKRFWSWKNFKYYDGSVRGEGYYLDINKYNERTAAYFEAPDSSFFKDYPPESSSLTRWRPTPISENEVEMLEFATPTYAGWKGKIVESQSFIRTIAISPGAYYSYRHENSTELYIISPKERVIILIYHNM